MNKNQQRHYFLNTEHKEEDFFSFNEEFLDNIYNFFSCSDVFSKNKIDDGTKILLKTIINNNAILQGRGLDLGCGYGVVGIVLKKHFKDLQIVATDINKTATMLTRKNAKQNKVMLENVFEGNLTEKVTGEFDYVFTNPPIKVGKEVLFAFITESYKVLKPNGQIFVVIRKDKGQESLLKHMKEIFANAEIINREKGYYILKSTKKLTKFS